MCLGTGLRRAALSGGSVANPEAAVYSLSTRRRSLVAAMTFLAVAMPPLQAQAGLFDFLFGGFDRPAQPTYEPGLGVRVNPRRKAKPPTEARRDGPSKTARQIPIDIGKVPNWHLVDPTLRRGDIVVLKTGAMVFEGGRKPATREDFTALGKSSRVSKQERDRILKMVGPPQVVTATTADGAEAPAKEAALRAP